MANVEKIKNDTCAWIGYASIILFVAKRIPLFAPFLSWIPDEFGGELGAVCAGTGATMLASTNKIVGKK